MAITFPLSLPASPNFSAVLLRPNSVVGVSQSPYTGSQQVIAYEGQFWEMDFTLPVLEDPDLALWESFFLQLNGREGTFLAGDPARTVARGTASSSPGTPSVNGNQNARISALPIKGASTSQTGYLLQADMIQIGTGLSASLHKVLEDADTDGSGNTTLTIWPKTRTALTDGTAIAVASAKGLFRLTQNTVDILKVPGIFGQSVTFSAMEAF